jgi:hypothetical protein
VHAPREVERHWFHGTGVPRAIQVAHEQVDHALTNEEILFDRATQPFSKQLAEAVETFGRIGVAA